MDDPTQPPHEEIEEQLSDLHDGTLDEAARAQVLAHLEGCPACRTAYQDLERTLAALGSIKASAAPPPEAFSRQVEETIHRRSAGRFFGRRTLGDRVPFGVLLVVALAVLLTIVLLLWGSTTGSLRI
jgi:anti-sigma factor RsiW